MSLRFLFLSLLLLVSPGYGQEKLPSHEKVEIPELKCFLEKDEQIVSIVKGPFCKEDSIIGLERYSVLTDRDQKRFYPHGRTSEMSDYISISDRSSCLYIFTKIDGKFSLSFFDRFGDASLKLESMDYHKDGNTDLFLLTVSGNSYCGFMIDCGAGMQLFKTIFNTCSSLDDTSRAIAFRDTDGDGIDEIIVAQRDYYRMGSANSYLVYDAAIYKWNESAGEYQLQRTTPFKKGWVIPKK